MDSIEWIDQCYCAVTLSMVWDFTGPSTKYMYYLITGWLMIQSASLLAIPTVVWSPFNWLHWMERSVIAQLHSGLFGIFQALVLNACIVWVLNGYWCNPQANQQYRECNGVHSMDLNWEACYSAVTLWLVCAPLDFPAPCAKCMYCLSTWWLIMLSASHSTILTVDSKKWNPQWIRKKWIPWRYPLLHS